MELSLENVRHPDGLRSTTFIATFRDGDCCPEPMSKITFIMDMSFKTLCQGGLMIDKVDVFIIKLQLLSNEGPWSICDFQGPH